MKLSEDQIDIIKGVTHALLNAFYYIRGDEHMRFLCAEVKRRVLKENCIWSDDGNIIYSALVTAFGDYGASPRSGWFPNEIPSIIVDEINEFINLSLGGELVTNEILAR